MKPTYTPPQKIISLRDDNELELVKGISDDTISADKNFFSYKYTKSETKLGYFLLISEKTIKDGIKHGTFMV